jgi:hypothetical protein
MARLIAALLLSVLAGACTTGTQPATAVAPVSASAPSTAVEWRYAGVTDYETRQPGLGKSYRYTSNIGWADVYVYGMRRADWAPGVDDPQFGAHFRSSVNDVETAARSGAYADLRAEPVTDLRIGGQVFRRAVFQYTASANGKRHASFLFLTARDGLLLKYRISFGLPAPAGLDDIANQFIARTLTQGLGRTGGMLALGPDAQVQLPLGGGAVHSVVN